MTANWSIFLLKSLSRSWTDVEILSPKHRRTLPFVNNVNCSIFWFCIFLIANNSFVLQFLIHNTLTLSNSMAVPSNRGTRKDPFPEMDCRLGLKLLNVLWREVSEPSNSDSLPWTSNVRWWLVSIEYFCHLKLGFSALINNKHISSVIRENNHLVLVAHHNSNFFHYFSYLS